MTNEAVKADIAEKPARSNIVFAFICLFLGYFFIRCAVFTALGAGMTAFVPLFIAVSAVFMKKRGMKLSPAALVYPVIMLALSPVFIISGRGFIRVLTLLFEIFIAIYWYFSASGCREEGKIGDMLPFDAVKSVFVMPFTSFTALPRAITATAKRSRAGRGALYILLGIACAIIPAAVIITLLASSDDAFANLLGIISDSFLTGFVKNLLYIAWGLPVAMYIFGLTHSCSSGKNRDIMTRGQCERFSGELGVLPPLAVYTAFTLILAIYALFFAAQSSYFLSAFASLKPEGFTYADYARKGFFELCGVSAINAGIICVSSLLVKRDKTDGAKPLTGLRVCSLIMCVFTLVLIATAMAKLYMYIGCYGLTLRRVNAAWFMLLLTAVFIFIAVRQFTPRFNFWRASAVVFTALFALLAFVNVDVYIARYNIARFCDGTLDSLDVAMFYTLSDEVLPEVDALLDSDRLDADTREEAEQYVESISQSIKLRSDKPHSFDDYINAALSYNLPRAGLERFAEKYR